MTDRVHIHYNPDKAQPFFDEHGIEVPAYPVEGDVYWKGEKVGFASNFNGLMLNKFDNSDLVELFKANAETYDFGIWNIL